MDYLFIITIALLIFFSSSLWTKKDKALSEQIFASWLGLLIFTELSFFLFSQGLYKNFALFFSVVCDTHVLHGAFLYFYVCSFVDKSFRFRRFHLLHLLPFIVLATTKLLFNNVFHLMECTDGEGCYHSDNIYVTMFVFAKIVILGLYIYFSYRFLDQLINGIDKDFQGLKETRINWIKNILTGVFILYVVTVVIKVLQSLGVAVLSDNILIVNILVSLFVLLFLYIGNSYAYIFVTPWKNENISLDEPVKSNLKKALNDQQVEQYYQKLVVFMKTKKPFLDKQLTLRRLAQMLDIHQNYLSYTINCKTGKNYSDFINSYRIDYFIEKIKAPENKNYTILALALESGFNSKASFHRIFKQQTGITPSQFIIENKIGTFSNMQ